MYCVCVFVCVYMNSVRSCSGEKCNCMPAGDFHTVVLACSAFQISAYAMSHILINV